MSTLRLHRQGEPPLEVVQDKALAGRDASCDVIVADKSVSRRHAYLERRGEAWAVVDQGSANGTFLDGKPVSESVLRHGQELRFGMVSLRVEIEADMPQTILMPAGAMEPASTMLMPIPSQAAPPAARPPAPPPARPVPPTRPVAAPAPAAAPPPAPARRPIEPPAPQARSLSPREEAAAFLGLPVGASPDAVGRRFEEMSGDLEAKVQSAPTPALRDRYQRNLDELRKACETLAPGFGGGSPRLEDLPSAQPSVGPDDMDVSIPAPLRAAGVSVAAASPSNTGAPPPATTVVGFLAATVVALSAFFCMSNQKMQKAYLIVEKSSNLNQARVAAEQFAPMENLEKAGALVPGQLKICNKAAQPLEVKWLGAIYLETGASGESKVKSYNSDNCRGEFNLILAPGSEEKIGLKGASEKCNWNGQGLFFALATKDPRTPDTFLRFSGTLNNRQDCVTIGEGL